MRYFSIMAHDPQHINEICEDIKYQIENGIADCPLFSMTLVPEGDPPVNKAAVFCEKYRPFQEKLHSMGLKCGILVQATIGHGYALASDFPFEHVINLTDGERQNVVCPYDEKFREHIKGVMTTLASQKPDVIMVDDDFRLYHRSGMGCACKTHMKEFNRRAGTNLTRSELLEALEKNDGLGKKYNDIYISTLGDSLIGAAKAMREGIDAVDPKLPGLFCACGSNVEFAAEIAEALAGKGNPTIVRINNGNYLADSGRKFSNVFLRAAMQIELLRGKADIILDETDTCPQNRYSTSAQVLHAHHVGTILEGASGAKHWITRLKSHEPQSGKAYRKKISENRGMYDALAKIVPHLTWRGCRIPLSSRPLYTFSDKNIYSYDINAWSSNLLERLGLPMYFSSQKGGVVFMEGSYDSRFSDEEIREMLGGNLVLSSDTAMNLERRGFGELLGVSIKEWSGLAPRIEKLAAGGKCNVQPKYREIVPMNDAVRAESTVFHTVDSVKLTPLFPGVTVYNNPIGGKVIVFSGTPNCPFNHSQPFSYLCESRKKQLIKLINESGELPIYYPEDAEVYLKAADMPDGTLFCAFFNLGLDKLDEIPLITEKTVTKIEILTSDGKKVPCSFTKEDKKITVNITAYTLEPVILFIS